MLFVDSLFVRVVGRRPLTAGSLCEANWEIVHERQKEFKWLCLALCGTVINCPLALPPRPTLTLTPTPHPHPVNAEPPTGRKLFRISRPSSPQERLRRPLALAGTSDTSLEVQADIFWQRKTNKTKQHKKPHGVCVKTS